MTAIDWLANWMNKNSSATSEDVKAMLGELLEMEKQHLYNFYIQGGIDCITQRDRTVEDFYNETFKNTKE